MTTQVATRYETHRTAGDVSDVLRPALRRRGLVAGAAALVAGIAMKRTAQPVAASTAMLVANTETGGVTNPVVGSNLIRATLGFTETQTGLLVVDARGASGADIDGIRGFGTGSLAGIVGFGGQSGGAGVYGQGTAGSGVGIVGVAAGATNPRAVGAGVFGSGGSTGAYGVYGYTDTSTAVRGESSHGNGVGGQTFGAENSGVSGVSGAGNGVGTFGVVGSNSGGIGVMGTSFTGSGVVGGTSSAIPGTAGGQFYNTVSNGSAVIGQIFGATTGAAAFVGAAAPGNFAGFFTGTVVINGQLVVSDPSYKSGALAHPDGTHRLVYCIESPESWIADVGTGTLSSGKATVTFDPDFAAVTHTDTYHVFLTEYAETQGLFVSNRGASGFTVQERNKGATSGTFSWKVMVKAKSSVKSERLGKFTMPSIKLADTPPHLPDLPTPPVPPKKP